MKKLIYTLIAGLFTLGLQAQNVEFKEANFKDKKEDLKKAKEAIKKGDELLKAGNELILQTKNPGKNFDLAIQQYNIAQQLNPNNAELNFKLGNAYIYGNEKYKAIKFIERANELDPECDPKLKFFMGMALHLKGQYDAAIQSFQAFQTSRKAEDWAKFIDKQKAECLEAKKITAKQERVWVDNIENINSPADDFNPCIVTDGSQLIFTSNRSNGHPANDVGKYDLDIYVTNYASGKWSSPAPIGPTLNTTNDESTSNMSYDGNKLLVYKNDNGNFDIYESRLMGANWETAKPLHKQFNSPANQTYAAYEPNDMKIYFLTDKEGVADNGTDFYTCGAYDRSHASYGAPVKESGISTRFNEGSIYLHPDNETMYFTSEGHNSIGGYDIFVSYKKQGQWTEPINLGYPINTPYDETFVAITASGKYAYIASNREGGKGGLDIYKVTFWGPEKKLITDTEDYLLAGIAKPIVDNTLEADVKVDRKSLTVFKGRTIDAISRKPVTANIDIIDNSNGQVIQTISTNSASGKFLLSLNAGKNYGIAVKADGYLFHSENFDIPANSEYNLVDKEIELKNIAVGSKIALRNIFFAFGLSTLDPKSNTELDRLVKLMKDVPALKVEISGHTDNIGSESSNQKLSEDRAAAVVSYLVSKGIDKGRLTAKGYGSNRPVATNNSEEGRQQNRRTEFEITGNK